MITQFNGAYMRHYRGRWVNNVIIAKFGIVCCWSLDKRRLHRRSLEWDFPCHLFNALRQNDAAYMHRYGRPSLVQIMSCRPIGAKPLSEQMPEYCSLSPREQISVAPLMWMRHTCKSVGFNYSSMPYFQPISSTLVSDSHLSPPGALQSRRTSLQWT